MTIRAFTRFALGLCLTLLIIAPAIRPPQAMAADDYPLTASDTIVVDAVDYLLAEQLSDGSIGGFGVSGWAVMALAAAEEEGAVADLVRYLEDEADPGSFPGATDWARMILAIVAAGEDPADFGGEDYIDGLHDLDEIEESTGNDYLQMGDPELLNDDIFGVLALEAAGESVDPDVIEFLLYWQSPDDGGWGIDIYSDSDVDVTAAAIMALIASGASSSEPAIEAALEFLADSQNADGGFPELPEGESNAASDAWAIMAIMAADGDPNGGDWDQTGGNPVDHLLSLQDVDGYFNQTDGNADNPEWMTCYVIPALLGTPYPVPPLESSGGSGDAEIEVSHSSLVFYATEDGDDPLPRDIVILNGGAGDMDWEVDVDEVWLEVGPSSGTSDAQGEEVTVSVDISGLTAGDYQATITITSDDAVNSPEEIDVDLHVEEETTDNVVMFFPGVFEFVGDLDEDENPGEQVLEIWNSGPDTIDWEIEVECDEGWLSVSPATGDMDGEHIGVQLSVDIDGLDPDDYEATITIIADEAENDGETIAVTLEVTGTAQNDDAEIEFSPSRLEFEAVADGDDPDSETLQVWNAGDGSLHWVVSGDEDWLSLSPMSGTSNGEKDTVSVSVDISGLEEGEYSGEVTIEDDDDSSNRETLRVTLVIEEAEPEEQAPEMYILVATTTPEGAGTITRSVTASGSSYPSGTTITLTATPSPGYAFVGWAGEVAGSAPTTTVVMSNHRSVVARFLRFDASGLTNVRLAYIPPDLTALTVMPYPVESIPSNPPGFRIDSAYVVQPEGSGTFALEFNELTNADSVALFQVVNGSWTQVPRTVMSDTSLQVTLPVSDTVLTLASPGSSSSDLWQKVTGFFGSMDSTTIIIVAGLAALALVVIAIIALLLRRDSY